MPLAFESESHGTVAFGFFNIESDMLLLDQYFFFATDFCATICTMLEDQTGVVDGLSLPAYVITDPAGIGDLHGGISGTHYSGFIGESYKKYPFPKDPIKFKQQTGGDKTTEEFAQMILGFGQPFDLVLHQTSKKGQISMGPYAFSQRNFMRLIDYVNAGGYPGWLDDVAPAYVLKMQEVVVSNRRDQ